MGQPHTFTWASSVPQSVIVTGTFDDWQSTVHLKKDDSIGHFSGTVDLPYGSKVLFKYIIDGNWTHNPREPCESDERGLVNNVLYISTEAEIREKEEQDRKALEAQQTPASPQRSTASIPNSPSSPYKLNESVAEVASEIGMAAAAAAVSAGAALQSALSAFSSSNATTKVDDNSVAEYRESQAKATSIPSEVSVPNEKPADPAPTPAVLSGPTDISSAPSSDALDSALNAEKGSTEPSVLPLVPETTQAQTSSSTDSSAPRPVRDSRDILPHVPEAQGNALGQTQSTSDGLPLVPETSASAPAPSQQQTPPQPSTSTVSSSQETQAPSTSVVSPEVEAQQQAEKGDSSRYEMPAAISYPAAAYAAVATAVTAGVATASAAVSQASNAVSNYTAETGDNNLHSSSPNPKRLSTNAAFGVTAPSSANNTSGVAEVEEIKDSKPDEVVANKASVVQEIEREVPTAVETSIPYSPAKTQNYSREQDYSRDVLSGKEEVTHIKESKPDDVVAHKTDVVQDIKAHIPTTPARGETKISSSSAPVAQQSSSTVIGSSTSNNRDLSGKTDVANIQSSKPDAVVEQKKSVVEDIKDHIPVVPAVGTKQSSSSQSKASSSPKVGTSSATPGSPARAIGEVRSGTSSSTAPVSTSASTPKPAPAVVVNGTSSTSENGPVPEVLAKTENLSANDNRKSTLGKSSGKKFTKADNDTPGITTNKGTEKTKRYSTLGRKDSSTASAASEAPVTPKKGAAQVSSVTPASTGKETYTTAPSTPATPRERERKSSFFQKVKSALSPHSKK